MVDSMLNTFPFVEIPERLRGIVGEPDPGTRIFRRAGTIEESEEWFETICRNISPQNVSPGGVAMYVRVSRAGVHKKMKEGKLTAFCFHVTQSKTTVFGYQKKIKQLPFVYIPVSE